LWRGTARCDALSATAIRGGWRFALGGLTLLWVNLHGGYLAGLLVLSAFWFGALLERNRSKLVTLTVVALVCAAVSLLNPNGYQLHLHNVAFLRSEYLTNLLGEYRSPKFSFARDRAGFWCGWR